LVQAVRVDVDSAGANMIEMPGVVGDVVRSVGLSTAMKAAGVVTGLLPIAQPMLLVGPGSSKRLAQALAGFGHRRILIVTDETIVKLGLLKGFTHALKQAGAEFAVFDAVTPDAPIPVIERGLAFYTRRGCDAVVGFGGGSPIDAAKVIAYAATNKAHPFKLAGYFRGLHAPAPIYAVPTTAGTGSEVTVAAVMSDPESGRKLVVADTRLVPSMAALDPSLMVGLPPAVTAATGMDALTHAVEAFIGQWATEYTDRMALAAVALIYENLRVAWKTPRSLEARERMSLAATYAGLAFTRANVGYVHAIAHQLGGKYHTPHGLANAIMLPHVLRFLAPAVTKRLALLAVAARLGKSGERPAALAKKFLDSIDAMNRELGIPLHLDALREADIPELATAACWEADTNYPVPKYMSPKTCEGIIRAVLPKSARKAGRARPDRKTPASRKSRG
jgi:alcohol dehydrogenase